MAEKSLPPPAPDEAQKSMAPAPPDHALSSHPQTQWLHASQPVFVIEDSFYRSRTPPRPAHWSIAWSDLMMTMFILFLVLFAHLRTHQEILSHGKANKAADETVPVNAGPGKSTLLFHPITQDISLKLGDQSEVPLPNQELQGADILIRHRTAELPQPAIQQQVDPIPEIDLPPHSPAEPPRQYAEIPVPPPSPEPEQPSDLQQREKTLTKIYDLSKHTLENEKLKQFASVHLVPDKTIRIILTGDLLFDSGQTEFTRTATDSLKKLSAVIKETPYMINVIGHTDDRPVKARFPSNWELSLNRASRVARFLIEETKLPPSQFTVSGYSSFRPLRPNSSEENRKVNRRVEIILSKELPQAEAATTDNLQ